MNPKTGSVSKSAVSHQADASRASGTQFNSTLINGLKKSGNGIVIKVPAGVKSVNVRPMNASSQSSTDLGSLKPTKVSFNNTTRDNFITLRFDADGKMHATVVDDNSSALELDAKMGKKDSKVGIINGENRLLNETKNLRIRESVDGKFNTADVRFLQTAELQNVSARLSNLFKKFRSMTENRDIKNVSLLKKFKPAKGKHGRSQQKNKEKPKSSGSNLNKATPKKTSKEAEHLKATLIQKALTSVKNKIDSTNRKIKKSQSEKKLSRQKNKTPNAQKHAIQKLENELAKMKRGLSLLKNSEKFSKKEVLERNRLLVGLFMDEKKRLFQQYKELNLKRNQYREQTYGNFTSDFDNIEASISHLTEIENKLIQFDDKKERTQEKIRMVNELIKSHGGYQILTLPSSIAS